MSSTSLYEIEDIQTCDYLSSFDKFELNSKRRYLSVDLACSLYSSLPPPSALILGTQNPLYDVSDESDMHTCEYLYDFEDFESNKKQEDISTNLAYPPCSPPSSLVLGTLHSLYKASDNFYVVYCLQSI